MPRPSASVRNIFRSALGRVRGLGIPTQLAALPGVGAPGPRRRPVRRLAGRHHRRRGGSTRNRLLRCRSCWVIGLDGLPSALEADHSTWATRSVRLSDSRSRPVLPSGGRSGVDVPACSRRPSGHGHGRESGAPDRQVDLVAADIPWCSPVPWNTRPARRRPGLRDAEAGRRSNSSRSRSRAPTVLLAIGRQGTAIHRRDR